MNLHEKKYVNIRFISNCVRFGCGYQTESGRKQYFAFWGKPYKNDDYFFTAEITEEEFLQINSEYPDKFDADQEHSMPFREKYIDGHPLIPEGWNRLPK